MTQLDQQLEQLDKQIELLEKDQLACLLYLLVAKNLDLDQVSQLMTLADQIRENDYQTVLIIDSLCERIKHKSRNN